MSRPETSSHDQLGTLRATRRAAHRAAVELARCTGAGMVTRPIYPSAATTIRDLAALSGMRASRHIELGARHSARDYLREEARQSSRQVGDALGLTPDADADQACTMIAQAAYTYGAENPGTETALRCRRSFVWTCQFCDHTISDRGFCNGPPDDEHGHANNCLRLSAAVAALNAEWEAGQ